MPDDLSLISYSDPTSTEAVSNGDDRIRKTREATMTSFGGTDAGTGTQLAEHYLKGFHKFPSGSAAARPAAGNSGRLYLNTTDKRIERDTGAAWVQVRTTQPYVGTCSGALSISTSFGDIPGMTVTADVLSGSQVILCGMVQLTNSGAATFTFQLQQNGTGVRDMVVVRATADPSLLVSFSYAVTAPSTGSVVYKLTAKSSSVSVGSAGATGVDQLIAQVL